MMRLTELKVRKLKQEGEEKESQSRRESGGRRQTHSALPVRLLLDGGRRSLLPRDLLVVDRVDDVQMNSSSRSVVFPCQRTKRSRRSALENEERKGRIENLT